MPALRKPAVPKPAKPAETERQFKALMRSDPRRVAFVRSRDDWNVRVGAAKNDPASPLHGVDPRDLREFEKSLKFGENGGLAAMRYGLMAQTLTFQQFRDFLGLFGIGIGYFADHEDRYCAERGTCRFERLAICTSNC